MAAYTQNGGGTSTPVQSDSSGDYSWVEGAVNWVGEHLFGAGGNPRSGGSDPCCPPGYDPSEPWPRNANVGGAPPDYRSRGAPMESDSPNGGRLKDDVCDCIPIMYGGKLYMIGGVSADGGVRTGIPADRDNAVWVQVTAQGAPVAVPGIGPVTGSTSGGPGQGTGKVTPGASGVPSSDSGEVPTSEANLVGGLGTPVAVVVALGIGAALWARSRR
jgi:hypothetical protein